ncbi:unnamed protein product [Protopolystoma xenopodis]|uniref:Uncharacterized protein n=1 Tax=Protopolystoma xenopodis TaxID=117903 RepID=A0A448WY29_9PLAT|nr:unnamed protein product [Protopolystoma xenopodis]
MPANFAIGIVGGTKRHQNHLAKGPSFYHPTSNRPVCLPNRIFYPQPCLLSVAMTAYLGPLHGQDFGQDAGQTDRLAESRPGFATGRMWTKGNAKISSDLSATWFPRWYHMYTHTHTHTHNHAHAQTGQVGERKSDKESENKSQPLVRPFISPYFGRPPLTLVPNRALSLRLLTWPFLQARGRHSEPGRECAGRKMRTGLMLSRRFYQCWHACIGRTGGENWVEWSEVWCGDWVVLCCVVWCCVVLCCVVLGWGGEGKAKDDAIKQGQFLSAQVMWPGLETGLVQVDGRKLATAELAKRERDRNASAVGNCPTSQSSQPLRLALIIGPSSLRADIKSASRSAHLPTPYGREDSPWISTKSVCLCDCPFVCLSVH